MGVTRRTWYPITGDLRSRSGFPVGSFSDVIARVDSLDILEQAERGDSNLGSNFKNEKRLVHFFSKSIL